MQATEVIAICSCVTCAIHWHCGPAHGLSWLLASGIFPSEAEESKLPLFDIPPAQGEALSSFWPFEPGNSWTGLIFIALIANTFF